MKKIICLLLVTLVILTGCGIKNTLVEQLESLDQIEYVCFNQTYSFGVKCYLEDCSDDLEEMFDIFSEVSSDGEPFEEYLSEGFHRLNSPNIIIQYSSGDCVTIEWESSIGVLIYNDVEYYIDMEHAQELYDIFTKYCPNQGTQKLQ